MSVSEYRWIGKPVKINEDLGPIRGRGIYLDDIELPNTAYMAYLRSPLAHARIKKIDVSKAKSLKGVIAVYTGEDISKLLNPFPQISPNSKIIDYPLAVKKVRYFGEPVAVVVAEDKYVAEDATHLIDVEYEPLPAVIDPKKALEKNAPLVHEENGSNIVWHGIWNLGDIEEAFKQADEIIEEELHFERYIPAPLETNIVIGNYDDINDIYVIYTNNVMPMFTIPLITAALNISPDKIRMIVPPNVGGSFGGKIINYTHMTLAALLSRLVKRPVKYVETRTENISSGTHTNERIFNVKVAVKRDGTILGIKIKAIDNCGAYPRYEPAGAVIWSQVTHGMYRVRNIYVEFYQVMTNKGPTGPVRGYSRIQHNFMWERIIDIIARKLGLDPVDVRLKNYIRPEEMPYEGPSGVIYDGGDYINGIKLLLKELEYEKWRELQKEYRN
ncbi:MAG: xanthine dehydrogenase family protein molybdopterin-binding subunit [Sulfolobaceae archaeon]